MNDLQLFKFENKRVRSLCIDGEPWFVGSDVTKILGYQNGSRDINRHVEDEDRQNYQNGTFDSPRGMTIINESGLYSLQKEIVSQDKSEKVCSWHTKEKVIWMKIK